MISLERITRTFISKSIFDCGALIPIAVLAADLSEVIRRIQIFSCGEGIFAGLILIDLLTECGVRITLSASLSQPSMRAFSNTFPSMSSLHRSMLANPRSREPFRSAPVDVSHLRAVLAFWQPVAVITAACMIQKSGKHASARHRLSLGAWRKAPLSQLDVNFQPRMWSRLREAFHRGYINLTLRCRWIQERT